MRKLACLCGAFVAAALWANGVGAVPVYFCKDGPAIDLVNVGCISGTAGGYPGGGDGIYSDTGGGDPEAKVEGAILGATGIAANVSLYGKTDDNPLLFSIIGVPGLSGTWDVLNNAIAIAYITIKAANSFALYDVQGANSGVWTTLGILNNGGKQPEVSHISFWTTTTTGGGNPPAIPLPAALPLFGSALVGAGLIGWRKRRKAA